jgi:hypothetical protein
VHACPVAAVPFAQVQVLAWQTSPVTVQPVLQLAHFAALFGVQLGPVAACPLSQVQVFALQVLVAVSRLQPVLQLWQISALFVVQACPNTLFPFVHEQVFALQPMPSSVQPVLQLAQI